MDPNIASSTIADCWLYCWTSVPCHGLILVRFHIFPGRVKQSEPEADQLGLHTCNDECFTSRPATRQHDGESCRHTEVTSLVQCSHKMCELSSSHFSHQDSNEGTDGYCLNLHYITPRVSTMKHGWYPYLVCLVICTWTIVVRGVLICSVSYSVNRVTMVTSILSCQLPY